MEAGMGKPLPWRQRNCPQRPSPRSRTIPAVTHHPRAHCPTALRLGDEETKRARIWTQPAAPTVYHRLMLICEVTGDPGPQEFLWEKEESPVPLQKGPHNVLFLPSFNDTHLGTYTCTASSPQGTAVATYTLWINDLQQKVFVFPQESQTAHVQVTAKLEQPLHNFTVCLRSFTDLTRPYSLFSYATKKQSNEILLFKPKPGQYELAVGNKLLFFTVPVSLGESEHVCVSWESSTGIVGFWFNGKPWPRKGLQRGYTVGVPASILLGQDQDSFGGGFEAQQSFVGEISSVYMWDTGISNSEVLWAMHNKPIQTPIFGWRDFPYKIVGDVYLKP
ncbi:PREDICTED: mucosal pentraxin-like isoform X2 [Pseudopodoces humilis]|uniref:mucosal pentraxin-like isoform X2 n=1 Tax=Pseudopodoces humilis TaxID=181119 RepID=UPI0006B7B0A1|nr:PREDICTED: mucosal pentraxin-like isoform X2 [Pseudopodoces humilis]